MSKYSIYFWQKVSYKFLKPYFNTFKYYFLQLIVFIMILVFGFITSTKQNNASYYWNKKSFWLILGKQIQFWNSY